jgi:phosphoglycerol transferase
VVASVVSYWILTTRLVGVNVSVLVDEYSYVIDAHYRSLGEASYPNHLFQLVYSSTKLCGAEFYSCARSLNAVFVIGGALFLYFIAKSISNKKWLASAVALGAVFGSYGTYTAYFMPEAIFNFPMIVFYWAVIRFSSAENLLAWAGFGLMLGIASLAKPHAFFVIPAVIIYILLLQRATKERYFLGALLKSGTLVALFFASKFVFGFLISGERGLSVLGKYASLPQAGGLATEAIAKNSGLNVIGTSWGQTLMITMIIGVALPVAVHAILNSLRRRDSIVFKDFSAGTLIGLSLLNMMAVSAIFEAWGNLDIWMHTRYYSYLIPLSAIVLLEAYSRARPESKPLLKRLVVAIFMPVATVALITAAIPYGANWIDAPDFKFHIDNLVISSILMLVSIGLAIWWLWDGKTPMLVAALISLLASVLSGSYISNFLVASFGQDSSFDQLGRVLRNYLPQEELDKTLLIGENQTLLERALFIAMTGKAQMVNSGEEEIAIETLDPEARWLVKVGEANVSGLPEALITGTGYSIYSLKADNSLDPRNNDFGSIANPCTNPANTGWSCGSDALISLERSVPAFGEIDLIIDVSEEAATGELDMVLGESSLTGTFPKGIYSITLKFSNSAPESDLIIRSKNSIESDESGESKFVRVVSVNINR